MMTRTYKVFVFVAVIGSVLFGLAARWTWLQLLLVPADWLALWGVVATFALPCAFYVGFFFGKTEVRGFLGGMDKGLDRVGRLVDMRDNSRVAVHNKLQQPAAQQPNAVVLPPEWPQITSRSTGQDEVIDL
jgi:hypothetical protein